MRRWPWVHCGLRTFCRAWTRRGESSHSGAWETRWSALKTFMHHSGRKRHHPLRIEVLVRNEHFQSWRTPRRVLLLRRLSMRKFLIAFAVAGLASMAPQLASAAPVSGSAAFKSGTSLAEAATFYRRDYDCYPRYRRYDYDYPRYRSYDYGYYPRRYHYRHHYYRPYRENYYRRYWY